jgi:Spy/CpxP family protein refolding chaperone
MGLAVAGCNSDDPTSVENSNVSTVPDLSEILAAVSLDAAQTDVLTAALGEWRKAEPAKRFGRRGSGDFNPERMADMHRPLMNFVASVAPSLDNDQLADLAEFLVQHREQRRERMRRHQRDGNHFGRGKLAEELGLDQEQIEAMKALRTETREAARELREKFKNGEIMEDELAEAMTSLRAQKQAKLAEILTEEQLALFEEKRQERMQKMIERRLEHMGQRIAERVEWLTIVLGLVDDQPAQIRTALEASVADRKSVLEALRDGNITREEAHTQMREIKDATAEAISSILTDEQAERLQAVRSLHPRKPKHW